MELPKTAKAAILIEQKKPLLVAKIDLPDKLARWTSAYKICVQWNLWQSDRRDRGR